MLAKVRLWHVLSVAAATAIGYWTYSGLPSPPDFTQAGFTSIHVNIPGKIENYAAVSKSSNDATLIADLAALIRTGKSMTVCRCGTMGTVEFRRPDGTSEVLRLIPTHDEHSVEFRHEHGRFKINREAFLNIVAPMALPAERWVHIPEKPQ